eukprot:TRINITY_DN6322_c0_g3_i1.p1 TRINITY_DN6322_c0_g3~~TRINITY_DN6322_c0_g3_i1.p1  ORF type:complete len:298 (-),score=33.60 TRINITY_DN6322_c0_g3_i1:75-929(-)
MLQNACDSATWQLAIDTTSGAMLRDVAEYLTTRDVASWQAVNAQTRNVLESFDIRSEDCIVWKTCAESELPQFDADDRLYEGESRQSLLRCHALLLRARCPPGCMIFIDDIEEASFLACQLRNALAFCEAYHSECGRAAHLLLGYFQLMRSATGTWFEFGAPGSPSIAGLPQGVLKMTMNLERDRLVTRAIYAKGEGFSCEPYMHGKHVRLSLNVWSGNPGIHLCFSGVPVVLDGAERSSAAGLCTSRSELPSSDPVLCVLTLVEDDARDPCTIASDKPRPACA